MRRPQKNCCDSMWTISHDDHVADRYSPYHPSRSMSLQDALHAHQAGKLAEAERGYRALLRREPRNIDALYLLGVLLHQSGRSREALTPLAQLANRAHVRPEHLNTLGDVHRALGEFTEARAHLERALTLRADYADAIVNLANTNNASGRKSDALVLLFNAVAAQPTATPLRLHLASMLQGVALQTGNELVREVLRLLCTDQAIAAQSLAGAVLGLIKGSAAYQSLYSCVQRGEQSFDAAWDALQELTHDELLRTALPRLIVNDWELERVLTAIRATVQSRFSAISQEFIAALAQQCFNTEYAWAISSGEQEQTAADCELLGELLRGESLDAAALTTPMLRVSLYTHLTAVVGWERLAMLPMSTWPEVLLPIVREQLHEPLAERALAESMPALTAVHDDTSQRVRAMYEENPYPRWVALQQPPVSNLNAFVRALRPEHGNTLSSRIVLVAGCGSGQQPIQLARTHPDADVLGVDLSMRSLAYAARMAEQFGVSNVRFAHGDLLELGDRVGLCAMIACSGVLHHLRDPLDGWRRLLAMLAPDGVMKIGLYSTAARTTVEAARAIAREQQFAANNDGIRACRHAIASLPPTHPARAVMDFVDFYSLSGVRDLVMHVQETTYNITQIAAMLDQLNLRFLGFQLPQPVQAQFHAEQGREALLDLAAWDRFERTHPDAFAGMYQFWCCRRS